MPVDLPHSGGPIFDRPEVVSGERGWYEPGGLGLHVGRFSESRLFDKNVFAPHYPRLEDYPL